MIVEYTVSVDCNALVSELIEAWQNGNRNDVIRQLATDHAGLTAMLIVCGASDGKLSKGDCNEIANRLIDARREIGLAGLTRNS